MNVDTHHESFFSEPELRAEREKIVREREERHREQAAARRAKLAKVVRGAVAVAVVMCLVAVVRSLFA